MRAHRPPRAALQFGEWTNYRHSTIPKLTFSFLRWRLHVEARRWNERVQSPGQSENSENCRARSSTGRYAVVPWIWIQRVASRADELDGWYELRGRMIVTQAQPAETSKTLSQERQRNTRAFPAPQTRIKRPSHGYFGTISRWNSNFGFIARTSNAVGIIPPRIIPNCAILNSLEYCPAIILFHHSID